MEEFRSIRCATCQGVAHPATGCAYTETFIVCGPCTRQAWAWIRQFTAGKGRRPRSTVQPGFERWYQPTGGFYDHVNRIAPPIPFPPAEAPMFVTTWAELVQVADEP